jgi:translation initiation factor IF-3
MDYGKWKYSQKKKHKKHHEQQLKQVRIRPKTDDFDREIKVNRAIRFLKKGDKVQFTMVFRGRERAHRDLGVSILSAIAAKLGELVKLERPPSMDGRHMIMIVSPIKAALDKYKEPEGPKDQAAAAATPADAGKAPRPAQASDAKPSDAAGPGPSSADAATGLGALSPAGAAPDAPDAPDAAEGALDASDAADTASDASRASNPQDDAEADVNESSRT